MTLLIANARMYAVTPEVEEAWRDLVARVAASADLCFDYLPYPAPRPLEELWRRPDLGCVQMCGYPVALRLADVQPIAAPVPRAPWAAGRPVYRSDLIVRTDSPYRMLEDATSGRLGWTVEHSHSGFNALRHHLLRFRPPGRSRVFAAAIGPLVTARNILDCVIDGTIDVGPLDAYWHLLIRRHRPELLAGVRVIDSTAPAPIPSFVMAAGQSRALRDRMAAAFARAHDQPWFAPLAATLCLDGFRPMEITDYAPTLRWDAEARAAGYPMPA